MAMSDLATFLGPGKSKRHSPATLRPRHVMEVEEHFDDQSLDVFCFPISGRSNGEFTTMNGRFLPKMGYLGIASWTSRRCFGSISLQRSEFEITRDQKVYMCIYIY